MDTRRRIFAWIIALSFVGLVCGLSSCMETRPPVLDTLRPNQGLQRSATKITVLGARLPSRPVFVLANLEHTVTLTNTVWKNEKEVEAVVPANTPTGRYDLILKNEAGEQLGLLGGAFEVLPDALTVYAIEAGQGDATLIISPTGQTMLIDASREEEVSKVIELLQFLRIQKLDHVIATHYDADHVGGFEKLFKGRDGIVDTADDVVPLKKIWDYGGWSKNPGYAAARNRFPKSHQVLDGKDKNSFPTISLGGDVEVEVRVANGVIKKKDGSLTSISCGNEANCKSIGVMVKYGKFRFWTAGDLTGGGNGTPDVETKLSAELPKVDVYRAHHHGSKTSSNSLFMRAIEPQVVLISSGTDNTYCHPHAEVLQRYLSISQVWILVTSAGIAQKEKCGDPTKTRISRIGNRGVVSAGNIRIVAEKEKFILSLDGHPEPYRFDVR
ncbi:MAG TPA: hypothetical protein DCE42_28800 [Myxococcales bacterium]|nr:hypothetical protein [Myxococcales bacterium]